MLRIARGAAVAAGQDLAFAEQGIDHGLSGLFDTWGERFHRLLLGFDAGLEKLANTGLHVHRYLTFKVTGRPRGRAVSERLRLMWAKTTLDAIACQLSKALRIQFGSCSFPVWPMAMTSKRHGCFARRLSC